MELYEAEIIYDNGKPPGNRSDVLSVAEKLHPGEENNLKKALYRALREELDIYSVGIDDINEINTVSEIKESGSFPGLTTRYTQYIFEVKINDYAYNSEGYTEKDGSKTTYFKWRNKSK